MTAQELFEYRREPYQQELVDGILYEMEPPGVEHGAVAARIAGLLMRHVERSELGIVFASEVGFLLATEPDTVRAPDVSFVAADRVAQTGIPRQYWPGPPDLAVEVVSPNDRHATVEATALHWLDAGTRAVMVVQPRLRTVTVYLARDDIQILRAGETLDLGDVVPGWSPDVDGFFV